MTLASARQAGMLVWADGQRMSSVAYECRRCARLAEHLTPKLLPASQHHTPSYPHNSPNTRAHTQPTSNPTPYLGLVYHSNVAVRLSVARLELDSAVIVPQRSIGVPPLSRSNACGAEAQQQAQHGRSGQVRQPRRPAAGLPQSD